MTEWSDLLAELLDVEDGLRDRDVEFLESLDAERAREEASGLGWTPSHKQQAWLEDLYQRHC